MQVLDATVAAHDALSEHFAKSISDAVEIDTVAAASYLAKASQALEINRAVSSHIVSLLDPSTP
jgi:hypothetical protein